MSTALPLAGIRVLTFENFGAGPFGSLYLANLGAEVVKIENRGQGGDATRGMGPFFLGPHDSHCGVVTPWQLREAVRALRHGGLIAYPTEAVYGLGCDPRNADAVLRLLDLKQRPWQKGLILIAADLAQLEPYLLPLDNAMRERVAPTWPGPNTWLLPARPETPSWLRGEFDTLAVRVTAHPVAAALCRAFGGPIVSTSANLAGKAPATTPLVIRNTFGDRIDYIVHAPLGGAERPTQIRDGRSGEIVRAG